MQPRDIADITEAQRITGLDKSTIYKLARQGRIRSFKVLSGRRFDRADLLSLITEQPAPEPRQS